MHGNTYAHTSGYKTRDFDDVMRELHGFFAACDAADVLARWSAHRAHRRERDRMPGRQPRGAGRPPGAALRDQLRPAAQRPPVARPRVPGRRAPPPLIAYSNQGRSCRPDPPSWARLRPRDATLVGTHRKRTVRSHHSMPRNIVAPVVRHAPRPRCTRLDLTVGLDTTTRNAGAPSRGCAPHGPRRVNKPALLPPAAAPPARPRSDQRKALLAAGPAVNTKSAPSTLRPVSAVHHDRLRLHARLGIHQHHAARLGIEPLSFPMPRAPRPLDATTPPVRSARTRSAEGSVWYWRRSSTPCSTSSASRLVSKLDEMPRLDLN